MSQDPQFDYYAILDVSRMASTQEIKSAFRKQAILYHPDKVTNPAVMAYYTRLFQNMNEACSCLSDEQSRRKYDEEYHYPPGELPNNPLTPTPMFLAIILKIISCKTAEGLRQFQETLPILHLDEKLGKDEYAFVKFWSYLKGLILSEQKTNMQQSLEAAYLLQKIDRTWLFKFWDLAVELKLYSQEEANGLRKRCEALYDRAKKQGSYSTSHTQSSKPKNQYYWENGTEDTASTTHSYTQQEYPDSYAEEGYDESDDTDAYAEDDTYTPSININNIDKGEAIGCLIGLLLGGIFVLGLILLILIKLLS